MGSIRSLRLGAILALVQVLASVSCEEAPPCQPGFTSDHFIFKVDRRHLLKGRIVGKVTFDDCTGRKRALFNSEDSRFKVDSDGTIKLKRAVTLHEGHKSFAVHAWDSNGKKLSTRVTLENKLGTSHHHHPTDGVTPTQVESSSDVPVLVFPQLSSGALSRQKRDWVIPPFNIPENAKGPFPQKVVQIRSSNAKEVQILYSITGPGASEPPEGVFTIDRNSGIVYVTQPLDREAQDQYVLMAHAIAVGGGKAEDPMELIITVSDQNDNKPEFIKDTFLGNATEGSQPGAQFMKVLAIDKDDPKTYNGEVVYSIVSQDPKLPNDNMFMINSQTGAISVASPGLDREKYPEYKLIIQAADTQGQGLSNTCTALITVTDSNDNAPQFVKDSYAVSVPENEVGYEVVKLPVTDDDEPHTPAWNTKYTIIKGNEGGFFNVSTGPNKLEGIITTAKALDFEGNDKYTLLVTVENEVPFATRLPTATATVIVNVVDVNEAPVFNPREKSVVISENIPVNSELTTYAAKDPDTARMQTVWYRVGSDPAGWLNVSKDTGLIRVKSPMDRESKFLKDGVYKALILAIDNDEVPATGTGTLLIRLEDVNDNAPAIDQRDARFCNEESEPILLSITDEDGPSFSGPFSVELQGDSRNNWTATMNETKTGIRLMLKTKLEQDFYNVVLRVYDAEDLYQDNIVKAEVCNCKGADIMCQNTRVAGVGLTGVLGILGAILGLLLLVLLLLMFLRRRSSVKKEPLIPEDDIRDNVYYYDEEGGGEEDQDYDLSQLHRGLDNRPEVFRNDVAPPLMSAPQYRPRPANPEEIGNFIDDNLKAADNDPTAPPYDSLLVFDYEGGGSEAGSLSSLNSSSSGGDQDYDCLNQWGPRFKKLADMYGGGED
ncbi:CADH1 protein, partial [Amia calva]|nr:CADH1 protein [Amia calva]